MSPQEILTAWCSNKSPAPAWRGMGCSSRGSSISALGARSRSPCPHTRKRGEQKPEEVEAALLHRRAQPCLLSGFVSDPRMKEDWLPTTSLWTLSSRSHPMHPAAARLALRPIRISKPGPCNPSGETQLHVSVPYAMRFAMPFGILMFRLQAPILAGSVFKASTTGTAAA